MTDIIDPNDVYYVLRTVLDGLPPGTAKLERDDKWGRSQLSPTRTGAAGLYGVGNVEDCEIGIVEMIHSHFDNWDEALEFCRAVVSGDIEYTIWREGAQVVRAQRNYQPSPEGGGTVGVMEALVRKPAKELRKEIVRFAPYV
jgi:hypothetical protein